MTMYLAIAEAERTSAAFERPFSIALSRTGYIPSLVRMLSREFMVARTLKWCSEKREGRSDREWSALKAHAQKEKLPGFAKFLNELPIDPNPSLLKRFDELVKAAHGNSCVGLMWDQGNFPSALSKFYMAKTSWSFPPFDSHAANSLGIGPRKNLDRARAYYRLLDDFRYQDKVDCANSIIGNRLSLHPSRIFDKFLIMRRIGVTELAQAFADSQQSGTTKIWQEIADDLVEQNLHDWAVQ